ncbi:hypothetical protein BVX97_06225 [bacterium E08(2017)]|nr:hypothetical protein BVX97_06225 [bacterium E08(2017)]
MTISAVKNTPPAGTEFFCSWSGGKDSCLAAYRAVQAGCNLSMILTMLNEEGVRSRSHGLTEDVLRGQSESIGVPIMVTPTTWDGYESAFIESLNTIGKSDIKNGVFGDIDFIPHLEWEEKVCGEAGMTPYLPLWKVDRRALLEEFLDAGFQAMIVTIRSESLDESYLGRYLDHALIEQFEKIGIDPCGENGEYHTVVTAGPLFKEPLSLNTGAIVERAGYLAVDVGL